MQPTSQTSQEATLLQAPVHHFQLSDPAHHLTSSRLIRLRLTAFASSPLTSSVWIPLYPVTCSQHFSSAASTSIGPARGSLISTRHSSVHVSRQSSVHLGRHNSNELHHNIHCLVNIVKLTFLGILLLGL